ncbi:hypothetical protein SERLA73DRAFT_184899 [Serpula lacrymans var. lacrymans S7.3]|uniref:Uncharacterized protein n=2 Tax=Serpula lacrymans var. lacrymans TaxID=341189 RepID=F8Q5B2_SERL3|nr:uncharacterized protein SERLADRAFT_473067 [Serpula lacrymans var. lacrymans S7.9]EGN96739.1 hypothetical protein SERLA73DRAFT_184899 [Serpula lacrymans var. lacrymans S7.3]EGO22347.1 hypothetical protein SERLADRAFT_473067 [Serpula lacrymans var. lacrymans S7.9]
MYTPQPINPLHTQVVYICSILGLIHLHISFHRRSHMYNISITILLSLSQLPTLQLLWLRNTLPTYLLFLLTVLTRTPLQHLQPSPPQMSGQVPYSQDNRMMNGHNGTGIVNDDSMVHTRSFSGTSVGQHGNMKQRGAPPARHAWSYGPGVGMGGYGVGNINNTCSMAGETVGPRLSSTMRRTSGTSSSSTGNRTPGDEASSTASSSTTSSSSRRTFTSTSSQHPLPARPDWAVGLKPQPTLHATHPRHHDHSLNSSRNMSPARNSGQLNTGVSHQPHQLTSNVLQPTDFPPLTTLSPGAEKRAIPVAGAWTNSSSTRSILMPGPSPAGNVLVHHSNTHVSGKDNSRLEDSERGFERPPPKGNVELFNPKGVWKSGANPQSHQPSPDRFEKDRLEKEKLRGEVVANAILVDKVATMSVEDKDTTCAAPPPVALAT